MIGHIKLHRTLLNWEWYDDLPVRVTFIHFLLKANWKEGNIRGVVVKRGQLITGTEKTPKEIGISKQQFRTAINKLKSTGEITTKSTNKYTLVDIVNYDRFQKKNSEPTSKTTTKPTHEQQANNNQNNTPSTTSKEDKKLRKEEVKFIFKNKLIDYGFKKELVDDWLKVRKLKKTANTETAFNRFIKQIELLKTDKNEILEFIIEKSWAGFKAEWYTNEVGRESNSNNKGTNSSR